MNDANERRLLRRLGLKKVEPDDLSIERYASGRGFTFRDANGATVRDRETRGRIAGLAIPPAWRNVRIAADPHAHLQAVGRDEAGRLQYLYHPAWNEVRAARKVERLLRLGRGLQRLRVAVARDLANGDLANGDLANGDLANGDLANGAGDRRTMLAAAAALVDRAGLRAGHEAYAGPESGRGAATLLKRHVIVEGHEVKLAFPGKGGRRIEVRIIDRDLARVMSHLKQVRGARLFKLREGPSTRPVTAEDLNDYLREASGEDITAKDFRTFRASARALEFLCASPPANPYQRRKCLAGVARQVGDMLNNTASVARSSYIHPVVVDRFEDGRLDASLLRPKWRHGLDAAETGLMRVLEDSAWGARKKGTGPAAKLTPSKVSKTG